MESFAKTYGTPENITRIRLFLWKFVHRALPVSQILHHQLQVVKPICALCGDAAETVTHALFHCPQARATWFLSSLA